MIFWFSSYLTGHFFPEASASFSFHGPSRAQSLDLVFFSTCLTPLAISLVLWLSMLTPRISASPAQSCPWVPDSSSTDYSVSLSAFAPSCIWKQNPGLPFKVTSLRVLCISVKDNLILLGAGSIPDSSLPLNSTSNPSKNHNIWASHHLTVTILVWSTNIPWMDDFNCLLTGLQASIHVVLSQFSIEQPVGCLIHQSEDVTSLLSDSLFPSESRPKPLPRIVSAAGSAPSPTCYCLTSSPVTHLLQVQCGLYWFLNIPGVFSF